ncbi:hypothetical protein QBC37DRAFT_175543 [Rhypophila decipiens]|uniref:YAG7-like dimerisation domain-containing protein n=1 Tax=Rhypophila decipiens TaxID=261697 RepID=A0AAN7B9Q2_9PEZI|nr:hypothetical protein QBC37DRAFT_175543 [Rhypophila decipiens]
MAASVVQNPPAQGESKSARKKKAKAAERTESPAPAATATPDKPSSVAGNQDDLSDNSYIRELQKSIRNVTKKITNAAKIDHLVAEHNAKTLDELVAQKIINADQKAAYLKKPSLQAQLFQFEEQLAQHKKIDQEHRAKLAEQEKTLTEKFVKEKAELEAELKEKAEAEAESKLKANFLILSQFLRLAAARRIEEPQNTSDEGLALEGVLLHIYSGDEDAVSTILKLVKGVEETTRSVADAPLQTTYAQVKQLAIAYAYPEGVSQAVESEAETKEPVQTDPTVANASLTEIQEGSDVALTNGHSEEPAPTTNIPTTDVADNAANAAGESQWDSKTDLTISQEWVDVKAQEPTPTETEAPVEAVEAVEAAPAPAPAPAPVETAPAPAVSSNNPSWADDHPEPNEASGATHDGNDGFHQVQRNRGGNREGGYQGRGRGRGRGGFRPDGRGRGRGGQRGVPSRPRRGGDEQ